MVFHAEGAGTISADEFLFHPAAKERSELVRGHIRMMTPASGRHGLVSGTIFWLLTTYVRQQRLGTCFADSTGYTLPNLPNTVRAPDASFVRADRLSPESIADGFLTLAPDLAVEVLSPSESKGDMAEKLDDYRVAGVRLVWVIDVATRAVRIIGEDGSVVVLGVGQELTGGTVIPGFSCDVSELFEGLAPPQGPAK